MLTKLLKLTALTILLAVSYRVEAQQVDTLEISDIYTTHIIFSTDVTFADLSNQTDITGEIIEQSKNKIAVKAVSPFTELASLSAEEANGTFHTFILRYNINPKYLIYDKRIDGDQGLFRHLDTLYLSTKYISHCIFPTDIIYADLSNTEEIAARIVEEGKNKLALKANRPFAELASVSAEEANGVFHTYILKYADNPPLLTMDTRSKKTALAAFTGGSRRPRYNSVDGEFSNSLKKEDAPLLSEVMEQERRLYHLARQAYDIRFNVENIFSYSDITYIVLSIENGSQISYETADAVFVIEPRRTGRKRVVYETNLSPKNKFGALTAAPGQTAKIAYSFDKTTLSNEQLLKIYLYEKNGQRNIELTLNYRDINNAVSPFSGR